MVEPRDPQDEEKPIEPKADADEASEADGGPRVSRIRVGSEDILVLSVPLPTLRYPEGTTVAEQEIIDLVLQGLTAKEIAEVRGASLRTVTTQLGAIFRKAGVNSQPELIATLTE
ncbi:MAG: helix-turn-helix transcriptional regulator [Myxococcota bacterium]